MIDTIAIQLRRIDAPANWDIEKIAQRFDYGTVKSIRSVDSVMFTGKLKNLKILITPDYLKINGSLAKYYFDNNLQTMTHEDIVTAVVWLGSELELPIERGYIKRIDVARNIIVKKQVNHYLKCFDETDGYDKNRIGDTLFYTKTNRTHTVTMYDKIKELKKNETEFYKYNRNGVLKGKNILRYEVKLEQRINHLLNYKSVRVVHLRSKTFIKKLNDFWYMKYKTLLTKKTFAFSTDIDNYGEFKNELLVKAIQDVGIFNLFNLLEELRKAGKMTSNQKAYAKREIKRLVAGSSSLIELDPTVELGSDIEFLYANVDKDKFADLKNQITTSEVNTKPMNQIQRKKFV